MTKEYQKQIMIGGSREPKSLQVSVESYHKFSQIFFFVRRKMFFRNSNFHRLLSIFR